MLWQLCSQEVEEMEYEEKLDFQLIGRRVRDFRMDCGLTQEKLAEAAELSVPWEKESKHFDFYQACFCAGDHGGYPFTGVAACRGGRDRP